MICDKFKRLLIALSALPDTEEFQDLIPRLTNAIEQEIPIVQTLPSEYTDHRRGKYTAVGFGISFGQGQSVRVCGLGSSTLSLTFCRNLEI